MSQDRAGLLATLAQGMTAAADGVPGDWDGFSAVAEITALGVRVTGFRYLGDAPGLPMLMDSHVIDVIAELRTASLGPNGEMFDVYVARLDRQSGEIVDQAFVAETGAAYRVTAANVGRIAALARPGLPFLPPSEPELLAVAPEAAPMFHPEPEPTSEPEPEPTPEPEPEPAVLAAAPTAAPESVPTAMPDAAATPEPFAALTAEIVQWPELSESAWDGYGAAVSFGDTGTAAIGFRYADGAAVPTFVGGAFFAHLHELRVAAPGPGGELPGAALVRVPGRDAQAQVRFVYGPAATQIAWTAPDDVMAARLSPHPAPGAAPTVAARPAPDLLEPAALLARLKQDVAASLRGRDGWRSFALGMDVARNRAAAFVYTDDGTPQRWQPILSPIADLAELRTQTARSDGSQWAGVTLHSWRSGGDRVDVTFHGDTGISEFLGQGPDAAGIALRPNADPPPTEPLPPWPPAGGHLDNQALVAAVSAAVLASPELAGDDWNRVAVVIAFADTTPTVSALRFGGEGPGVVTAIPNPGPIGKLRRSNPNELGWLWDACILRGWRGMSRRLEPEYRFSSDAADLQVDSESISRIGDRLRPV